MNHLLGLVAAIALLVWGTYVVRTGVLRVFGANLRDILQKGVSNRIKAFFAGLGVTAFLQSATATALLTSSFQAKGLLATSSAVALMLGADVGSAVMVQVFSLDLSWLAPLLIAGGIITFMNHKKDRLGQVGETLLGLGIMILALQLIIQATGPMKTSEAVRMLFATLEGDRMLNVVLGVALAQVCYSSLAVVVLTGTLVAGGVLSLPSALAVVLGANLGSALLAVLTTAKSGNMARRAPLGNLVFKAAGVAAALLAFPALLEGALLVPAPESAVAVGFHLAFNIALAAVCLPATPLVSGWIDRMLPVEESGAERPDKPKYLDPSALSTPGVAIACATRETLRLAEIVHDMFAGILQVIRADDAKLARELVERDDQIDRIYSATKLYLTEIAREKLTEDENQRWNDVLSFAVSMEQAGDVIDHLLGNLVAKKIGRGTSFSAEGLEDLGQLHARLLANMQESVTVYLGRSPEEAQKLLSWKSEYRELDKVCNARHIARLTAKTPESIETSSLHLDMLADFKRLNSLVCSVAFPVLHRAGILRSGATHAEQDVLADVFERAENRRKLDGKRSKAADARPAGKSGAARPAPLAVPAAARR